MSSGNNRPDTLRLRSPRLNGFETIELVKRIPALLDIFKSREITTSAETVVTHGASIKSSNKDDQFSTDSILYLSRYNKESFVSASKQKDKQNDTSAETDERDDLKNETTESQISAIPSQNREKKRRFAISLTTLASKPGKRATIVKEGAIPVIIDMSSIDDEVIQRSCATALSYLAKEPAFRYDMIEANAFAGIISLASNCKITAVKEDCVRALCNLCCYSGCESRAVRDGTPPTVAHLASAHPELIDVCLKVLLNISCVSDKFSRLEELTEALLQICSFDLSVEQEILVLSVISNLSGIRGYQQKLVEDGCLRVVEKLLKSGVNELRILAAEIVKNFTTDPRTLSKLIENNVIGMLLVMSKDELEVVKTACVRAFYNLAGDVVCREKIVSLNAVSVIIRMSTEKFSNVERGRTAARTLRTLCTDRHIANRLVRDGIVKALTSLLRTDDAVIQQFCAESICSLFQISEILGKLVEQGAVGVIVSLSSNINDPVTGEWCAFALYHLATNEICPTSMLEQGIMPCLIKLCEVSTETTKYFCSAAFAYISQLKSVNSSNSIGILVHMLRDGSSHHPTKANCAAALYNMADVDENCDLMLKAGALIPVVRLTQSDHLATKMKCAAILSRLSLHSAYYDQFAEDDVLSVLLELSSVDHVLTQRRVVIALSNLSQSEKLRNRLLALDPIPYIISLAAKRDENLRRGCAAIVCNLAYCEGNEKAIVDAGIVPTLLITAMITSDQMHSKIICVKALVNLMADRELYPMMAKEGVIWGLSSLAQVDEPELLMLCAKALCCFSYGYAKDMLTSSATVNTILMLIQKKDPTLKRVGALALTNILLQTTDADEKFRLRAVEGMIPLAQSAADEEVSEMCVYCLCLASQSESCREAIVSSGMLSMIDSSTIFEVDELSYAYLTMVVNIANNPSMRTKLLDDRPDRTLQRFMQICRSDKPNLHIAVAKALYSISCAPENILKMAQHNALSLINRIWEAGYEKSSELRQLLLTCLYNMSTSEEAQSKLVSHGFVHILVNMWNDTKDDIKLCAMASLAICHLACGPTNSSRMVEEGCAPVLCNVSAGPWMEQLYKNRHSRLDLHLRTATALRNLLCVVANQRTLVEAGCIYTLIHIARETEEQEVFVRPPLTRLPSSGASLAVHQQHHRLPPKEIHPDDLVEQEIRQHCAAALRCITYNKELRDELTNSGAVAILLDDLKADMEGDMFSIGHDLLCELEAESWENGTRGRKKDGRAHPIAPAAMNMELLKGSPNVKLNVEIRHYELDKWHVQVQLDEPRIELEAASIVLEMSINDLAAFTEYEDQNANIAPMNCPKQECEISDDLAAAGGGGDGQRKVVADGSSSRGDDDEYYEGSYGYDDGQGGGGGGGFHSAAVIDALQSPAALSLHETMNNNKRSDHLRRSIDASRISAIGGESSISPGGGDTAVSFPEISYLRNGGVGGGGGGDKRVSQVTGTTTISTVTTVSGAAQISGRGRPSLANSVSAGALLDFPKLAPASQSDKVISGSGKIKKLAKRPPNEEKQFKSLITMIKHTKHTRGSIDDVLQKWEGMPKL